MRRRQFATLLWIVAGLLLHSLLPASLALAAQSPDISRLSFSQLTARMQKAVRERDQVTYVAALAAIATRHPADLDNLTTASIWSAFRSSSWKSSASSDALYGLHDALFTARWTTNGAEPNSLHLRFVRMLIERQEWSKAGEVMQRLNSPRALLELKADRRSDPLLQSSPASFDIDASGKLYLNELAGAVQRYPIRLAAWNALFTAYLDAGGYRQVLDTSDQLLVRMQRAGTAGNLFEDPEELHWTYDIRSRAYYALGDLTASERELKTAAGMAEHGKVNVSNALNLAYFYAMQGTADSALDILDSMAKQQAAMSEYGRMTEMQVRHIAALSKGNSTVATETLEYLRVHRDIARNMLLQELIREEKFAEAASEFVSWLADPEDRWDALTFVQGYAQPPYLSSIERAYAENLETWVKRDDVRQAIDKVGRIESVRFTSPMQ